MMKLVKNALFLLLSALCVLFISACAKQQTAAPQGSAQQSAAQSAVLSAQDDGGTALAVTVAADRYRTSFFSSPRVVLASMAGADNDTVYLWGYNHQDETTEDWVLIYNPDGSTSEQQLSVMDGGYITALDVSDGQIVYLERVDRQDEASVWYLHTPQGAVQLDWASRTSELRTLIVTAQRAYLADGNRLYQCSLPDGAVVTTADTEARIDTIFYTKDGRIVVYCEETGTFYALEDDGQALRRLCTLPLLFQSGSLLSGANTGYDCLVIGESALFGWNFGAADTTQLLSFDTYGLSAYNLSALTCTPDGSFLGATWRSGEPYDRLFWIERSDGTQTQEQQKTLRIGGISRAMLVSAAIADFKALYPEYVVEYIDYQELYGDKAAQQLQIDLVQGSAPDLLFVNGLPMQAYAKRGLFENLYDWIDAEEDLSRDDFTANLLAALQTDAHSLYQLPQSYTIATTVGTKALAGSRDVWTFAAINDELEQNDTLRSAFYNRTQQMLVESLPMYMLHTLVDYTNAESLMESEEALAFLTFLDRVQPSEQLQYDAETEMEALQSGEILFSETMLARAELFAQTEEEYGTELVYPGFPGAPGGCFYLNYPMAIPATAAEKEGAWAFMKMLFTSSYYANRGGWIPLQSGFEASMQDALAQGVSEQSVQKLTQLQSQVHTLACYDEAVTSILADETGYLFAGIRTVEEAAEQIDQRIRLYLTEQLG